MPRKRRVQTTNGTFGRRLAELRQTAGYSQRELAAEVGISQRMIAYYEGQTDHPPTHVLPVLAEVLGVSADELLGLKVVKRSKKLGSERLYRRFKQIEKLPSKERKALLGVIDAFLERDRLARREA